MLHFYFCWIERILRCKTCPSSITWSIFDSFEHVPIKTRPHDKGRTMLSVTSGRIADLLILLIKIIGEALGSTNDVLTGILQGLLCLIVVHRWGSIAETYLGLLFNTQDSRLTSQTLEMIDSFIQSVFCNEHYHRLQVCLSIRWWLFFLRSTVLFGIVGPRKGVSKVMDSLWIMPSAECGILLLLVQLKEKIISQW